MFQQYTASSVNNIYHPYIFEEWKANIEKGDYEYKIHKGVEIPAENRELDRSMNVDHFPRWLMNEIECLQFQGILEHTAFHARAIK